MRSQLRRDLHNHADDQLYQWVTDTFDTYQRVDLDADEAAADVILSMMTGIGAIAAAYAIPPGVLTEYFRRQLEVTKTKFNQATKESQQ